MHGTTTPGAAPVRALRAARRGPARRAGPATRPPPRPLHCLVVEDNPTNQLVVTLFLRKLGVTHDLVGRGTEALAALAVRRYDLVLMDIEMPVLDGYATTRALREREAAQGGPRTPVIALSADALPDSRAARRRGRNGRLPDQADRHGRPAARARRRRAAPCRPPDRARPPSSDCIVLPTACACHQTVA